MPTAIWNLEWLNANAQRRYPLTEDSSGRDASGSFALPASFLLELDMPIHQGLNVTPARFFLRQLSVDSAGFLLVIGYQPTSGSAVNVATALVPRGTHQPGNVYALGGINSYADTVGKVVVGRLDEMEEQPSGLFQFSFEDARIEPDCVRPIVRGVSSLSVVSGTSVGPRMYGDIELVAGDNIQLVPIVATGQNPQIRISAIKGEGLAEECVCIGDEDAPCIKRINGIPPTADGNFTFLGNACLTVEGVKNGIKLNDVCSEPCCGCEELEAITRQLEAFGSKAATLEGFVNRLQSEVTAMDMVVLGSKTGDRGCVQCG